MAARGRKAQPDAKKAADGVRLDRINTEAPDEAPGEPVRPPYLDDMGKAAWEDMLEELRALGSLRKSDGPIIGLYASTFSRFIEAEDDIRANGLTTFTDKGTAKANPSVAIARQSVAQLATLLAELGLTPSSRSRLKLGTQKKSRLAKFLEPPKAKPQ
ncbi:phage terminase small subunit P27 family [Singulisphaera sp. PoT]|uniref:phage terminase small subunit P27 family n=1 Tax=Singulisphaera sp. PoT TaxID=3411797 RepID=UPI003BF52E48